MDERHAPPSAEGRDPALLAHRNRLAGLWAAELLGLIGQAAQDYARRFAHHGEQGEEEMTSHLARDLHGRAGIGEIRDKMAHLLHEARRQLKHRDRNPN